MPDLILAESLLLIGLDDDSGKDATSWGSDPGLAGALLLDLVRGGQLVEEDKRLVPRSSPPAHPTLRAAHEVIAADDKPRKPSGWISRLPSKLKPLRARVAEPLVQQGVLEEERRKRLGMFETLRFPERDPAPERALRSGLREVLVSGREPTEDEALLLSLLVALDLVGTTVEKDERRDAKRRAKAVAAKTPSGDAVKQAIEGIQAAVMVSVLAATTTTTAGSS